MTDYSPSAGRPAVIEAPIEFPWMARPGPFDPPEVLAALRDKAPLIPMRFADGHLGWFVTGHSAVRSILGDSRFSVRPALWHPTIDLPVPRAFIGKLNGPGMFLTLDPPEHTRYRQALAAEFTVRQLKRLEPKIAGFTRERLDAIEESGPPADLVGQFAFPLPCLVICELLGMPPEDRISFQRAAAMLFRTGSGAEETRSAADTVLALFPPLIRRKRQHPGDDLLSRLTGNSDLSDEELATFTYLLFGAGFESTANMLALGAFALLEHPGQKELLRRDPALIASTVEELLRYLTIGHAGIQRAATEDVELEGVLIRKGQAVMMSLAAANRDPAQFENPDKLDITSPAAGHVAFGHGVHMCLGQHLVRAEMRIAIPALFARFPGLRLAVPPDEVPTRHDMFVYGLHSLPVQW